LEVRAHVTFCMLVLNELREVTVKLENKGSSLSAAALASIVGATLAAMRTGSAPCGTFGAHEGQLIFLPSLLLAISVRFR